MPCAARQAEPPCGQAHQEDRRPGRWPGPPAGASCFFPAPANGHEPARFHAQTPAPEQGLATQKPTIAGTARRTAPPSPPPPLPHPPGQTPPASAKPSSALPASGGGRPRPRCRRSQRRQRLHEPVQRKTGARPDPPLAGRLPAARTGRATPAPARPTGARRAAARQTSCERCAPAPVGPAPPNGCAA
jgi:hypothetical protein